MTDNSSNFNSLQERNDQVLNNISELQGEEQILYDSLDDATLSPDQKQQIINKINEISQMRLNLYANMKDMYSFYQQNASSSKNTLSQQMSAIDVIENELNEAKKRLNLIQDQKINKLRLVEINTYYGKQYSAHANIMKTIVIICIPLIILAMLHNRQMIPNTLYALLIAIVLIVGIFILGRKILDLFNHSNMNWDEYNWYFNQSEAPSNTDSGDSTNPWDTPSLTCIGSECCYEGSTYDSTTNICVPNDVTTNETTTTEPTTTAATATTTTETMISGVLSKYAHTYTKPVASWNSNHIMSANLVPETYSRFSPI